MFSLSWSSEVMRLFLLEESFIFNDSNAVAYLLLPLPRFFLCSSNSVSGKIRILFCKLYFVVCWNASITQIICGGIISLRKPNPWVDAGTTQRRLFLRRSQIFLRKVNHRSQQCRSSPSEDSEYLKDFSLSVKQFTDCALFGEIAWLRKHVLFSIDVITSKKAAVVWPFGISDR